MIAFKEGALEVSNESTIINYNSFLSAAKVSSPFITKSPYITAIHKACISGMKMKLFFKRLNKHPALVINISQRQHAEEVVEKIYNFRTNKENRFYFDK